MLQVTHREFAALHGSQLAFLPNFKPVGPGPVWNGLRPREVVAILNHLRYHFVVCLGTEESCDSWVGINHNRLRQFKASVSIKKPAYRSLPGTPRSFLDSPAHISH